MNLNKIIQFSFVISLAFSFLTGCTDLVNFSEEEVKEAVIKYNCGTSITDETPNPLFVVNDRIIHRDSLKNVNPEYIRSMSVLKGQEAITLFGSAGEHGVVKIQTDQKRFSGR
jgi:phosphoribosylaminoimidazole carboxylase (NCAIR synthetase)